jgi:hypothetical protein
VAAVAGCGAQHRAPSVVPWLDAALPAYRTPTAQLVRYPTGAAPCRAAQLRLRNGRRGPALGNYLEEYVVTNAGATTCLLRGYPGVTALDAAGTTVTLHPQPGGTYFGQLVASDVAPGGHVFFDLATSSGCNGGRAPSVRYHALALRLPQGGSVRGDGTSLVVQCGLSMSALGLPERYAQPRARPGTPGTLRARLVLPASARAGRLLEYTVVLGNPTGVPVSLRSCPGYTQGLFSLRGSVRETLRLNCAPVETIAPHARVKFAMRVRVPRRATGFAKVGWSLDTPTGPFAGGVVTIP